MAVVAILCLPNILLGASSEIDLHQVLRRLEQSSGRVVDKESARDHSDAIKALQDHSSEAAPLIIETVLDKGHTVGYRDECLLLLSRKDFAKNLTPSHFQRVLSIVSDKTEAPLLRIHAGGAILRNYHEIPDSLKRSIRQMGLDLARAGKSPQLVYALVFARLPNDPKVEDFLLERLASDNNKSAAMLALGKIRSQRALGEITKLLDRAEGGKSFAKARAYLALGDIGGERALDSLLRFYGKEKSALDRDTILMAIGRTKTARGEDFLLKKLDEHGGTDDLVILSALRFSGSPRLIPILEEKRGKERTSSKRQALGDTISAMQRGDDSTPW